MADPELFGPTFSGDSFKGWRAVARMWDGLPLDAEQQAFFEELTGRKVSPTRPVQEAYFIIARRSGKTLFSSAMGLHAAIQDYRPLMAPGEYATVALIACDRKQARQMMNYVKGLIADSPMIANELDGDFTAEAVRFKHRSQLEIHAGSYRSTRGYSFAAVIMDEMAFFHSDYSANPDVELVRAVRPGLATLNGRLLGMSSPHARRGHLYQMYSQHYGKDDHEVLVMKAPVQLLNPTIRQELIDKARAEDPIAARSEWDAEFRQDVTQFLPDEDVDRAIETGVRSRPAVSGNAYFAFVDSSGGRHDSMVLGVAHQDFLYGRVQLDKILIEHPPFEPEKVVERFAEALSAYGLRSAMGDRYGAEWVAASFRKYGVGYEASEHDKSAIYQECLPLFAQGVVDLLDIPRLESELRALERKPRTGGRGDLIDHPPGGFDDVANAACGALWRASRSQRAYDPDSGRGAVSRALRDHDVLEEQPQ